MRIYRGRELRINYGDYEGHVISGGVTLDHHDLGYTTEDVEDMTDDERDDLERQLIDRAVTTLARLQRPEIEAAAEIAPHKSFVHDLLDDPDPEPEKKVRRPRRQRKE